MKVIIKIYFNELPKNIKNKIYEAFGKEGITEINEVDDLINRTFQGQIEIGE